MQYLSEHLQMLFLVQSAFLVLALFLGIGIRRDLHRQLGQLKRQQGATEKTLRKFMEESEKTFIEVCRSMISNSHSSENGNDKFDKSCGLNLELEASSRDKSVQGSLGRLTSLRDCDKKTQVLSMSERGMSPSEIGSRLNIPRGEIELIINLQNRAGFQESRN